jgi:hypothetical protein
MQAVVTSLVFSSLGDDPPTDQNFHSQPHEPRLRPWNCTRSPHRRSLHYQSVLAVRPYRFSLCFLHILTVFSLSSWCFWIGYGVFLLFLIFHQRIVLRSVILGAPALVLVTLFCNPPQIPQTLSFKERLHQMDFAGAFLLLGSLVCVLIALQVRLFPSLQNAGLTKLLFLRSQEGGITTPWSDHKIIGLLVGFVLITIAFFALQAVLGEKSSISLRLLRDRSLAACTLLNWTCGATFYAALYMIPICALALNPRSSTNADLLLLSQISNPFEDGLPSPPASTFFRSLRSTW